MLVVFLSVLLFGGGGVLAQTPIVATNAATGVTDLAATLNGTVNPNGANVGVSFQYGTTTSYGSSATPSLSTASGTVAVSRSIQLTTLQPGTTYHYRFIAHPQGESIPQYNGADQTFTTTAAATPPTIGSISTLGVNPTSATVQANSVFSGSSATTVIFDYGLTASYGSAANTLAPIPTNSSANSSATFTGLSQGTTYHCRCRATNNEGTATSADATFTTTFAPTVVTNAASNVADIAATLNGTANANGGSVILSFDYGTTTSYGRNVSPSGSFISGNTDTPASAALTNLQPTTTYHYRLRGVGSGGTYFGADATFTTSSPVTPPSVDTAKALNVTATRATLEVVTLATGGAPATLSFEFGTTTAYGSSVTSTSSYPASTTFFDGSIPLILLTPGTTYHFRGKAASSVGTVYTPDATFTTPQLPVVTTTAATAVGDITATFNGSIAPNGGNYSLVIDYGPTTAYGFGVNPNPGNVSGTNTITTSATVALQPNTTYHYRLHATDSGFGEYFGGDQTFTTGQPNTPPTVGSAVARSTAPTTTTISIGNVTAGSSPATLVIDYGLTSAYGSTKIYPTTLATASSLSFDTLTVVGLSPSTTYHFRARVTNGQGQATTADATFTTQPPPVLATGAAGVSATTAALSGTINPHGGTFTMDFEYGLTTGYGLTASAGAASGIFNTSVAGVPNGLSPSTTYHYRLRANDGAGTFFYGSDLSFTTHSLIEDWRAQNFGTIVNTGATADNASFAGDGVPNLVKYALGLDPKVANVQLLPHISLITANGTTYLSYSFARNPALVDLTYEIIAADQPAGPWSTIASSIAGGVTTGTGFIVETPGSGNQINVEVHDIVSTTDAPHRYLELRISQ